MNIKKHRYMPNVYDRIAQLINGAESVRHVKREDEAVLVEIRQYVCENFREMQRR